MKQKNKKPKSRNEVIYAIALAGISSAVALLLVWLGVVVRFSTIAFFVAAGIALMVPINKKFYISALFAYATSSALAFAIVGDVVAIIGYIAYFGPMSMLTAIFLDKKLKWYFAYPIKILVINGALALMYFGLGTIIIDPSILGDIHYAVIALVGTLGLLLIDLIMQMVYKFIVPKVSRAIKGRKGAEAKDAPEMQNEDFVEDIFEEFDDALIFEKKNKDEDEQDNALFGGETDNNKDE